MPGAPLTLDDRQPPVTVDADLAEGIGRLRWRAQQSGNNTVIFVRKYREGASVRSETLAQHVKGGKAPAGMKWQHANGDQFDYRRENLTAVPVGRGTQERARSRRAQQRAAEPEAAARFVGVQQVHNRYRARIVESGQPRSLGTFPTAEEAARAYDDALAARGQPRVNFPAAPDDTPHG